MTSLALRPIVMAVVSGILGRVVVGLVVAGDRLMLMNRVVMVAGR